MNKASPSLAIIIPVYNEEDVLHSFITELNNIFLKMINLSIISPKSAIYIVNDGSTDMTEMILQKYETKFSYINHIKLNKNCGQQYALLKGIEKAYSDKNDLFITMDGDGQDPIKYIPILICQLQKDAAQAVYGVRSDRKSDPFFKRNTATLFYKIAKFINKTTIPNHGDFRVITREVSKQLLQIFHKKKNLVLRTTLPKITTNFSILYYKRPNRYGGHTHYTLKKMLKLAISSFS